MPDEKGGAVTQAGAGMSISDCVATPSRIVLSLKGDLDLEALTGFEVANPEISGSAILVSPDPPPDVRSAFGAQFHAPKSGSSARTAAPATSSAG